MTTVIKSVTVRKTGNIDMDVCIFSLRGAHLIAMFANTPIAKEFRKWVLDSLDSEVVHPVHQSEARELLTDDDTSHLARLIWGWLTAFGLRKNGLRVFGTRCVMLQVLPLLSTSRLIRYQYSQRSAVAYIILPIRLKRQCSRLKSRLFAEYSGIVRMQIAYYLK